MERRFRAISLSHEKAPVEIREIIYLAESTAKDLLFRLSENLGLSEALIFSTCNRTEVYYVHEQPMTREIISLLCIEKGIHNVSTYIPYFNVIDDEDEAVRYLFEVSMGLHSTVLGDLQISNQIKKAYQASHEANMAGAFLHRLLHTIFHTNKRVQQETAYRDGAASASYAAAELAKEETIHMSPRALILGVGEMGSDVARNLDKSHFSEIHIMNRSLDKAEKLAGEINAIAFPLSELANRCSDYDVIVSSVSVEEPILTPVLFGRRAMRNHLLIDLSVPRSVSPLLEHQPNIEVRNIDDIRTLTAKTLDRRRAAIPNVKAIISEEIIAFGEWRRDLSLAPTIHKIKQALEQIRKEELARFLKDVSDKEAKLVEEVTLSMLHKILKVPVLQLKTACRRGNPEELMDVLNELFDLEAARKKYKDEVK